MDVENLKLRTATEQDKGFAFQVKKAAYKDMVTQVYGWDEGVQRQYHEKQFSPQDLLVIQMDDTDIGILKTVKEEECLQINQIFILPEYQGSGIGTECISRVIQEADSLNLPVRLQVFSVNTRARKLYERLGFKPVSETDTHILMER